ncbi:hypothetical protein ACFYOT_34950 [Saccharothrix saharensis]|uniref:hypothetical protein n=1 Tax=Saccharothrix saharensis TaxID=571190 RepID=UPI0036BB5122
MGGENCYLRRIVPRLRPADSALPCRNGDNWQTWEVYRPKGTSRFGHELVHLGNRATGLCLNMDEYGGPRLCTRSCGSGPPPNTDVVEGAPTRSSGDC